MKGDNIVKTKATVCLAETIDKVEHCDENRRSGVFGFEQIPFFNRSYEIQGLTDRRVRF